MPLKDPIAAYNAENNLEAHLVRDLLADSLIEAYVTEDEAMVGGAWAFGLLPELHKPQVWIERADAVRAAPVIEEYERRAAERRRAEEAADDRGVPIEVVCEECGKASPYPRSQQGTVQTCPHRRAYVDVSDDNVPEEWRIQGEADPSASE